MDKENDGITEEFGILKCKPSQLASNNSHNLRNKILHDKILRITVPDISTTSENNSVLYPRSSSENYMPSMRTKPEAIQLPSYKTSVLCSNVSHNKDNKNSQKKISFNATQKPSSSTSPYPPSAEIELDSFHNTGSENVHHAKSGKMENDSFPTTGSEKVHHAKSGKIENDYFPNTGSENVHLAKSGETENERTTDKLKHEEYKNKSAKNFLHCAVQADVTECVKHAFDPTNCMSRTTLSERNQCEVDSPSHYFFLKYIKEHDEEIQRLRNEVKFLKNRCDQLELIHCLNEKNGCSPESAQRLGEHNGQDPHGVKAGFNSLNTDPQRDEKDKQSQEATQIQKTSISTMTSLIVQQTIVKQRDVSIQYSQTKLVKDSDTPDQNKLKSKSSNQSNSKKGTARKPKKNAKHNKSDQDLLEQENIEPLDLSRNLTSPEQNEIKKIVNKKISSPKDDYLETPKSSKRRERKSRLCLEEIKDGNFMNPIEDVQRHDNIKYLEREKVDKRNLAQPSRKVKSNSNRRSITSKDHQVVPKKTKDPTHRNNQDKNDSRDSQNSLSTSSESLYTSPYSDDFSEHYEVRSDSRLNTSLAFLNYGVPSPDLTVGTKKYFDKYNLSNNFRKPPLAHRQLYQ